MTVTSYHLPASLPEALGLLRAHGPELLVMAGGTVAMPLINEGISLPRRVMGLRHAGLGGIERTAGGLRLGATVTLTQLAAQDASPMLAMAATRTGSWAIRNLATVGGNLFTPPPGGDVATALLALDARVVIAGPDGERTVPLGAFHTGFMTVDLRPGELVVAVIVPDALGAATSFLKFGRKAANTPSVVTVAVRITRDGDAVTDARVAIGAAGPHPFRATDAEALLVERGLGDAAIAGAATLAAAASSPFDDAVASEWYRRRMVEVFVRRVLQDVARGDAAVPA